MYGGIEEVVDDIGEGYKGIDEVVDGLGYLCLEEEVEIFYEVFLL